MGYKQKKILVAASNVSTMNAMYNYLNVIFSDYLQVDQLLLEKLTDEIEEKYDLLIMPNRPTERTKQRHIENPKVVSCNRVYNFRKLDGIFEIEPNSKVYFVSDNPYVVEDSMQQLIDMGVIYFELIPYFPGTKIDYSIVDVITAGEAMYAPDHILKLVDLGSRIPCMADVIKITEELGLPNNIIDIETQAYVNHFAQILSKYNTLLQKQHKTKLILNNVFNKIEQGVCVISGNGHIKMMNQKGCELLDTSQEKLIGIDIVAQFQSRNVELSIDDLWSHNKLIKQYNDTEIYLTCYELDGVKEKTFLIYIDDASDISEKEYFIRKNKTKELGLKLYTFDDYITADIRMKRTIQKAKRIAMSEAYVLIEGESGTGKEIIAQAIHSASSRKEETFVAVNFAAIQPSLLDSELFGYVEGAFTGAAKGGNKGLIEMAHKGTLFLDEIGDAPLDFQVRLLRVLQEREIRRVGSSERIPVDCRIIAATNRNLLKMVDDGTFREDLFYRLNVMPLDILPLRERVMDIELIYSYYIKSQFNDSDIQLEDLCKDEVVEFLLAYTYKGNTRELKNLVEYFACVKQVRKIGFEDLPRYMLQNDYKSAYQLSEFELEVLKVIRDNPKIGRNKINRNMQEDLRISEGKIRTILAKMRESGYIVIHNTRGGCELTYQGKILLNVIN